MYSFSIGAMLESFQKPAAEAMALAKRLGAKGLQVYATPAYEEKYGLATAQGRKNFLSQVKDNGLVISALCGDLGHGFGDASLNPALIGRSRHIVDLALELETNIVTTHIGVVPEDPDHPRYRIMQDACGELARYADSVGAHFAVETGPEPAATLKVFLDSLHSTGVAVNLDPANLVMVVGDDPVRAVHTLKEYIVHTHAKDGRKLREQDPEITYGLRPENPSDGGPAFIELPLGEGDVPFPQYLKALDEIGYRGFLTIEREVGEDPSADIARAVRFLKEHL